MAVVPFVPVLAVLSNPSSGLAGAGLTLLALLVIVSIVIGVPLYFIVASFPLWLAAKIAVSGETTYVTAIKVMICQFLTALLTTGVAWGVLIMGATLGGQKAMIALIVLICLVSFFVGLIIVSNAYGIGLLHAFGLQILSFLLSMVVTGVGFFGFSAVDGVAGTTARLQASYQKLEQARQSGDFSTLTSPFSPSTSAPAPTHPPDYTTEIDNLLNTALHPAGPTPSLTEREEIVRTLQQKMQAQRASLPPDDAHAMSVYQNQLNRYMLLLEQVKAERKAHPLGEAATNPQAAR
jgi:hypothetical protein